jgi:uncharacterized membrane protein YhhN
MNLRKSPIFNGILFALLTAGTIFGQARGLHAVEYVCKPLMMIVLSSWFFFNSRRVGDRFTLLVQAGLFFSLIGDVALMFEHVDEFNFLLGLAAFLLAQVCYTLAFAHNVSTVGGPQGIPLSVPLALAFIGYGVVFAKSIEPRLEEDVVVPVLVYAATITVMGIAAALRYRRTYPRSFWMVLSGAIFFIASDSLLATDRFVRPIAHGDLLVMVTYALAQFLIAAGALAHVLDPESIRRKAALTT